MLKLSIFGINSFKKKDLMYVPFILVCLLFIVLPSILIFHYAFFISGSFSLEEKVGTIHAYIWLSIFRSIFIAFVTVVICLWIAYPFAYFVYRFKFKSVKTLVIALISLPIWTNFFVKLIGLKCLFDYIHGMSNSTFSIFFTILGLVYIFLPISIITIYNTLNNISQNIILSSHDLGYNELETIFQIIIPYLKPSFNAVISLVFFPALFSVSASDFLNNSNNQKMIGQIIHEIFGSNFNSTASKTITSFLIVFVVLVFVSLFLIIRYLPKSIMKVVFLVQKSTRYKSSEMIKQNSYS